MIGHKRAALAALFPPGAEHEVIDDELTTPVEEVGERLLALGAVEHVILLDLEPRQLTPLPTELITQPGELLFLCEMRLARLEPFLSGHDLVARHQLLDGLHRFVSFRSALECLADHPRIISPPPSGRGRAGVPSHSASRSCTPPESDPARCA